MPHGFISAWGPRKASCVEPYVMLISFSDGATRSFSSSMMSTYLIRVVYCTVLDLYRPFLHPFLKCRVVDLNIRVGTYCNPFTIKQAICRPLQSM